MTTKEKRVSQFPPSSTAISVPVSSAVNLFKKNLDELEAYYQIRIPRGNFVRVKHQSIVPRPITDYEISYVLHETEIMNVGFESFSDGSYLTISIFMGDWKTPTTQAKLNYLLRVLGGVTLFCREGKWFVTDQTTIYEFIEGMKFVANIGAS